MPHRLLVDEPLDGGQEDEGDRREDKGNEEGHPCRLVVIPLLVVLLVARVVVVVVVVMRGSND
jgi:flagellar basal body-associated protein FliL